MRAVRHLSKIIWAVDPFEDSDELREHTLETLRCLVDKTQARVEPVYVLSPAELNLSVDFTDPWVDRYRPASENALRKTIQGADIPNVDEPKVIIQTLPSLRNAVNTLSHYAVEIGADLIVVASKGRSGMSRLILGSFAESLLLHSEVPVLVTGKHAHSVSSFENIIFPTDLGAHSREMFESMAELALQLGSKITIFHQLPNPIEPVFQSGMYLLGGAWVPVHNYFSAEADERRTQINSWCEWASARGIPVECKVQEESRNVADAILELAEATPNSMIAMAARSGPITSVLVGSVTRNIVRQAPCPVWVLHPKKEAADSEKSPDAEAA